MLNTKIEEKDGKYFVTLEGDFDTVASVKAEEKLSPLYESNGKDIIMDCKKLSYIASSGLRIMLAIMKGARAGGSKVIMRDVNDTIKNVFKLAGFYNLFIFEESD